MCYKLTTDFQHHTLLHLAYGKGLDGRIALLAYMPSTAAISDSIVVSVVSITGMQNYKFLLTSVQDLAEI
jgi:hypothetical protein